MIGSDKVLRLVEFDLKLIKIIITACELFVDLVEWKQSFVQNFIKMDNAVRLKFGILNFK